MVTLRWRYGLPGLLLAMLVLSGAAGAQTATVAVDTENFRVAPGGNVLAEIRRGTAVTLGATRDRWREATLEGWIWAPSVREERAGAHDLVVAPPEGENLRDGPSGEMIARVRPGMRLQHVETRENWIRVRRTAWIWGPSLAPAPTAAADPRPSEPRPAGGAPAGGAPAGPTGVAGLAVLSRPAGDTVARLGSGARVEVLDREGEWVRVRIEGWAPASAVPARDDPGAVLRGITRADLRRNPDSYQGQLVEWTVQFIALQRAERFRTDFTEGQPFLLTRGPDDDAGFVYVTVPAERLEAARALSPLQRLRVLARIRIPRSSLTDAPVLDLIEMSPADVAADD